MQRAAAVVGAGALAGTALVYRNDPKQLQFDLASAAGPLLRLLDAETSHNLGIWAASTTASRLAFPRETRADPASLATTVWGRRFPNPIGLAAGFDKNAEAVESLLGIGFGFVEVGSVTPLPQPGNPKPRCFRLPEHGAIINRYGFNSDGLDKVRERLEALRSRQQQQEQQQQEQQQQAAAAAAGAAVGPGVTPPARGLIGVNLGMNKGSGNAAGDYAAGVAQLAPLADYLVINVSSPNTPGLRALQGSAELEALVKAVKKARDRLAWGEQGPPPLLVKIAPDLGEADKRDIAAVALRHAVDGLVVSNTTITRPGPVAKHHLGEEAGGLSGEPLYEVSTEALRDMYRLTHGRVPIIGVGGVTTGRDAYDKIRAGASLVELYTAFAYHGPALLPRIKRQLAACLAKDGFKSVAEAVGADHRPPPPK